MFSALINTKIAVAASAILSSFSLAPMALASNPSNWNAAWWCLWQAQEVLDNRDLKACQRCATKFKHTLLTPYTDYRAFSHWSRWSHLLKWMLLLKRIKLCHFQKSCAYMHTAILQLQKQWQHVLEFQAQEPVGEKYQCIYYRRRIMSKVIRARVQGCETALKLWSQWCWWRLWPTFWRMG